LGARLAHSALPDHGHRDRRTAAAHRQSHDPHAAQLVHGDPHAVDAEQRPRVAEDPPAGRLRVRGKRRAVDRGGNRPPRVGAVDPDDLTRGGGARLGHLLVDRVAGRAGTQPSGGTFMKLGFSGMTGLLVLLSVPVAAQGGNGAVTENEVYLGAAPTALAGTLTLPSGGGPFPAVVLVHGSGPHDRD